LLFKAALNLNESMQKGGAFMGRIIQPKGSKGSLKWIQHIVNDHPEALDYQIRKSIGMRNKGIEWLSPKTGDDNAEYRDQAFLELLGINPGVMKLNEFWPARGPQWDGLGRIGSEAYFLVEAKAHITENISSSQAKSPASKELIGKSLTETATFLNLNRKIDPAQGFYQYVNRLAHLYFLREINKAPAYLVFVYFANDQTHIPTTKAEWKGALQLMHAFLGSHSHKLSRYIIDVFIDVDGF
jgi:hypothetical protein